MAITYTKVIDAGAGWTKVRGDDGQVYTIKGSRAWRNNNPGNIEYGKFAKSMGAIGSDGRFAIFPSYDAGRKAKETLIFESPAYAGKTLQEAISKYAPSSENKTQSYINSVARETGIDASTPLSSLNPQQRASILDAMQRVEGFSSGTINGVKAPNPTTQAQISPPYPIMRPDSLAVAQSAPETALGAISGLLGGEADARTPALAYAPPVGPVDQTVAPATRPPGIPYPAPARQPNILTPEQQARVNTEVSQGSNYNDAAGRQLIANNVGGVADLIRNKFDPSLYAKPNYVDGAGTPPRMPIPEQTRQVASVTTPPTSYRIDLDKALGYARDTGQLTGLAAILPNSALYGVAQQEITKSIPPGVTFDPKTNTVDVQDRGLLTNPPVDPSTGKPANFQSYIDAGVITPTNTGTTETFPLPLKRPQTPPAQKSYPDISSWEVFSNPAPEVTLPRKQTTNQIAEQAAEQRMLRERYKPPALPSVPYAKQSVVPNKLQDRLYESDPRLAFAGDVPPAMSPAVSAIAEVAPPIPVPQPVVPQPVQPTRVAPSDQIRSLQAVLQSQGFNPGKIDGLWGPNTEAAWRQYQQAQNRKTTPTPSRFSMRASDSEGYTGVGQGPQGLTGV